MLHIREGVPEFCEDIIPLIAIHCLDILSPQSYLVIAQEEQTEEEKNAVRGRARAGATALFHQLCQAPSEVTTRRHGIASFLRRTRVLSHNRFVDRHFPARAVKRGRARSGCRGHIDHSDPPGWDL